mmetsp:Transcript_45873/g.96086  ORF Transcript_45873/g.96086 Transcript_45873/m.96086 type:complete len:161 (-) Transcript_45873:164-646(-)|eukprot:CAMPEP_0172168378 /NCGR_PEP_ID=MMETSP1050-20130122/10105_1 /TAXON_ID=233186 /ORGANISM="Cryptomonas curvata, Strain CCAP979/52" /LENGTH=160 /DNA_ID=CAMNT_0012839295 /DNA_START=188 /DNA_END=670 /DNA_ORIENTATION=-
MSTKKDDETKTILKNLLILILIFYLLQYIVCLILAASFNLWSYQPAGDQNGNFSVGLLPFWHFECGVGQGDVALTSWLSMVLSQLGLTAAIFLIVRSTKHAWDYSCTLSVLHFCVACAATRAFPSNWAWWVTHIIATILVSVSSELMCYFLHDLREIQKT